MIDIEVKGYGWDAFVESDLTRWAEEKGLVLAHQEIKAVFHKRTGVKSVRGLRPIIPRRVYAESPWTVWFDKNVKSPISFSISEYKSLHQGKRPNYALSFAERSICLDVLDRNKTAFILSDTNKSLENVYRIERERYTAYRASYERVYVERAYNISGQCTDVTLLHYFGTNYAKVLTNHRISSHKWEAKRYSTRIEPFPPVPYKKYFNQRTPWKLEEF